MAIIVNKEKDLTSVIIDGNCDVTKFYRCVEILKNDFGIESSDEIDGLDSLYWDFEYKNSKLSLHYNIYAGISIFPIAYKKTILCDNKNVVEIGQLIFEKINNQLLK